MCVCRLFSSWLNKLAFPVTYFYYIGLLYNYNALQSQEKHFRQRKCFLKE